jgi:hypothetical protein
MTHVLAVSPSIQYVFSPQAISAGMLRRPPVNLNQQSQQATVLLIREVIKAGIDLQEVYVDALGPSVPYQAYLSKMFPGISFTVSKLPYFTLPRRPHTMNIKH